MANELGYIAEYDILHAEDAVIWKSAAISVMNEATTIINEDVNTQSHQERLQWAHNVLANPDAWVKLNRKNIVDSVLKNTQVKEASKIDNAISDNDIKTATTVLVPAQSGKPIDIKPIEDPIEKPVGP